MEPDSPRTSGEVDAGADGSVTPEASGSGAYDRATEIEWCEEPECELRCGHTEEHQDEQGYRWVTGESPAMCGVDRGWGPCVKAVGHDDAHRESSGCVWEQPGQNRSLTPRTERVIRDRAGAGEPIDSIASDYGIPQSRVTAIVSTPTSPEPGSQTPRQEPPASVDVQAEPRVADGQREHAEARAHISWAHGRITTLTGEVVRLRKLAERRDDLEETEAAVLALLDHAGAPAGLTAVGRIGWLWARLEVRDAG